jgi:hypothetical protein
VKLPLWRLIAGLAVFGIMAAVLATLAPIYFDDFRLQNWARSWAKSAEAAGQDDARVKSAIVRHARELDLPVSPAAIAVSHSDGHMRLEWKYAVEVHLPLYQVDLHFRSSAAGR